MTDLAPVLEPRKSGSWSRQARRRLVERDGACCQMCLMPDCPDWAEAELGRKSMMEIDHAMPLSMGGSNSDDNLWLLCHWCHKEKTAEECRYRCLS